MQLDVRVRLGQRHRRGRDQDAQSRAEGREADPAGLQPELGGQFGAGRVDPAATVRELKQQGGKDIWLWGSLTLMNSLLEAGLVDEVTLLVCPVSRGKGKRVFEDRQDLKLIEATSFDNGLAVLRYKITK
ncbi:dihydrofolate reductase family protein [Nonomuraea jabiensis]|uniref:Riboflavin biosynthesis pyrimidine reductase n=1 Tax=Nonomuraea jabiensis TaxID=882448 RepID=A0A7W9GD14_9ACTN|nr:dihydrofolate reductase family protein [Nonomuraea jabiensis]MBB5781539.1 riboflavin biosynthesis pyrimidine reductase [Nonomuraea jabiensis]